MTDLTEQEIWKSMPEFDNEYEVSNLGRFRSVDRVIIRKGSKIKIKGRILKGQHDKYGYVTMKIVDFSMYNGDFEFNLKLSGGINSNVLVDDCNKMIYIDEGYAIIVDPVSEYDSEVKIYFYVEGE